MKRTELIKIIEKNKCILIRHGSKHDWYQNLLTKISQPIPRHSKINEYLTKHIIKMLTDMVR
jgi:mRNA interferase HicA